MKLNFFIIPLIVTLVAFAASLYAEGATKRWYKTLKKPSFTPKSNIVQYVWEIVFAFTAVSLVLVWNSDEITHRDPVFLFIIMTFLINAALNVFWNFLFYKEHFIKLATWEAIALATTVFTLMLYIYPISVLASILLLPYLVWVCFGVYLNYSILKLNA